MFRYIWQGVGVLTIHSLSLNQKTLQMLVITGFLFFSFKEDWEEPQTIIQFGYGHWVFVLHANSSSAVLMVAGLLSRMSQAPVLGVTESALVHQQCVGRESAGAIYLPPLIQTSCFTVGKAALESLCDFSELMEIVQIFHVHCSCHYFLPNGTPLWPLCSLILGRGQCVHVCMHVWVSGEMRRGDSKYC